MRISRRGAVWLVMVAAACGGPAAPAKSASTPAAWLGETVTAGASRVALVDAGREPRTALRYAVDGQSKRLEVRVGATRGTTTAKAGAEDIAYATLHVTADFQRTEDDRVLAVVVVVDDAKVGKAATPAHALEGLAALAGAQLVLVTTVRGQHLHTVAPDGNEAAATLGDAMADALLVPLPVEAVGIGARWTVRRVRPYAGIAVAEDITYALVETTGDPAVVVVKGTVQRVALSDDKGRITVGGDALARARAAAGKPLDAAHRVGAGEHMASASLANPGLGLNVWYVDATGAAASGSPPAEGVKVLVVDPRVNAAP
jgi:hypothetical protein